MNAASVLYLVRHCQATGQEPEAPLTNLGEQQAEHLAAFLRPYGITRIVSSPFRRARQSVEPLARALSLPVNIDTRLAERTLSTQPLTNWLERLQATWEDFDLVLPDGESSRAATTRGMAALRNILAAQPGATVVVAHGNLMSLMLHAMDGRPGVATWEGLTNPDVFRVAQQPAPAGEPSTWTVERLWAP